MRKTNQMVVSVLLLFLAIIPLPKSLGAPESTHTIAGYGPIGGELFNPKSIIMRDNQYFVLDRFHVTTFNSKTNQIIKQFPVDLGDVEFAKDASPSAWMDRLNDLPYSLINLFGSHETSTKDKDENNNMAFDSHGNLYILGYKKIQVYNPTTGQLIQSMMLNGKIPEENTATSFNKTDFQIYEDTIYLFRSHLKYDNSGNQDWTIYTFSLDGQLKKTIKLNPKPDIYLDFDSFVYIQTLKLFVFSGDSIDDSNDYPPYFFDQEGNQIQVILDDIYLGFGNRIAYEEPDTLITAYIDVGNKNKVTVTKIAFKVHGDGSISIKFGQSYTNKNFGFSCKYLSVEKDTILLITTGPKGDYFSSKIFTIRNDEMNQIYIKSQVDGTLISSLAFAIDSFGDLYTSNLISSDLQKFDLKGDFDSQIQFDLNNVEKGNLFGARYIFDIAIVNDQKEDFIYIQTPINILRYSLNANQIETYKAIHEKKNYTTLQYWKNNLYQFDCRLIFKNGPYVRIINEGDDADTVLKLLNSPKSDSDKLPFFVGFKITEKEFQFLDALYQEIWIYAVETGEFLEKVKLHESENSFYSSFDLYPDGSWIVTDVTQSRLLHISRSGELIETIGSKGQVKLGESVEEYLKNPDQFYLPIRAKIANNNIYVSDFGNCRYHIIPIEEKKPEPKPQIQWEKESLTLDKFSIFTEKIFDFNFNVKPMKEFVYQLAVSEPWMQIKSESGKSIDQKISVKILGEKLEPWKTNTGNIKVTFPDYPELNKEIPVTINAIGNIVKVTISSDKATVNDKEITLDKASIPLLKNGRTFVGIRFMGEIVFNNKATISYDPKSQTVFFELGAKKIELYIGKPYALVNGNKVNLDSPPFIQAGRSFIPLRFVSENLDASVEYDGKTQTITITYPKKM